MKRSFLLLLLVPASSPSIFGKARKLLLSLRSDSASSSSATFSVGLRRQKLEEKTILPFLFGCEARSHPLLAKVRTASPKQKYKEEKNIVESPPSLHSCGVYCEVLFLVRRAFYDSSHPCVAKDQRFLWIKESQLKYLIKYIIKYIF